MPSTIKRTHLSLTKETLRQLDELALEFGESKGEVMKRAITILYYITFKEQTK